MIFLGFLRTRYFIYGFIVCIYVCIQCMYVRVLADDDPFKIMTYHVSWLPSRNTACSTTTRQFT